MKYPSIPSRKPLLCVLLCLSANALAAGVASAQAPQTGYPPPSQTYPPPSQSYPQTTPQYPPPQPLAESAPKARPFRDLFAGTLAVIAQTATSGILGAVNGRLTEWFARQGGAQTPGNTAPAAAAAYPPPAYPPAPYPTASYPTATNPAATDPSAAYPSATYPPATYPPATTYPSQTYPSTTYPSSNPSSPYPASAPAANPAATSDPYANPYGVPAPGAANLYAGVAYEVYAVAADGGSTPVDTGTHEFRTGDSFKVYYRPSLPGRMEVYNVNPSGRQSLIDVSNMAAGQLTELGPYRFTNQTGDESLRLVLTPCSSAQLLATSRDIVRADSYAPAAPMPGNAVALSTCGAPTTRSVKRVRTRDIERVTVEGGTSYALDPVSQQEQASGRMDAREVTIVFRHR